MAMWRLSSLRNGKRLSSITLNIYGLPIKTFGSQPGTAYNPYVGYRHYSPLVASIAETCDMVGGLLQPVLSFPDKLESIGLDGSRRETCSERWLQITCQESHLRKQYRPL